MPRLSRGSHRRNPETLILNQVRGVLISLGYGVLRVPVPIYTSQKGWSDLLVIKNGKAYFVEIKTEKGRQRPDQKAFQEQVEAYGCKYFIIRSPEEAEQIFKNLED